MTDQTPIESYVIIGTHPDGSRFPLSTDILGPDRAHRLANSMNAREVGTDEPIHYEAMLLIPADLKLLIHSEGSDGYGLCVPVSALTADTIAGIKRDILAAVERQNEGN